jgi:CrcB protein
MIRTLLFVGVGGFLGSISRYLVSWAMQQWVIAPVPYATLSVNTLGSLFIGLIYGFSERGYLLNSDLRLFLAVGFCGGFTTFSTFSHENLMLLRDGQGLHFILYAFGSMALGLASVVAGCWISRAV